MADMSYLSLVPGRMPGSDILDLRHLSLELEQIDWGCLDSSDSQAELLHWLKPICFATVVMVAMIVLVAAVGITF